MMETAPVTTETCMEFGEWGQHKIVVGVHGC